MYNEDGRMWIIKGFLKSKKKEIINYIDKISDEAFVINYSNENKIVVDEYGEYENEAFKSHCSFLEKDILEGIFNIEKNVVIIVIKKKYFNFTKMLSFNFDYIMEYKYNCYTYENKKIVCKEVKESESPF